MPVISSVLFSAPSSGDGVLRRERLLSEGGGARRRSLNLELETEEIPERTASLSYRGGGNHRERPEVLRWEAKGVRCYGETL
jgi:hypothetical protein